MQHMDPKHADNATGMYVRLSFCCIVSPEHVGLPAQLSTREASLALHIMRIPTRGLYNDPDRSRCLLQVLQSLPGHHRQNLSRRSIAHSGTFKLLVHVELVNLLPGTGSAAHPT